MHTDLGNNIRYFAVFDGHGVKGKEASDFAKEEIKKALIKDQDIVQKFSDRNILYNSSICYFVI